MLRPRGKVIALCHASLRKWTNLNARNYGIRSLIMLKTKFQVLEGVSHPQDQSQKNGNSANLPPVVNDDPDPDYGIFRSGKRCSEGDIARKTCLVPLLSNGTSCSLVNERKMAITDF